MAPLPETRDATVFLDFAGETRRFRVAIGELEKIQDDCGAGPFVIAEALARATLAIELGLSGVQPGEGVTVRVVTQMLAAGLGPARIGHVRSVILHGLIGGGMGTEDAFRLVKRWIDPGGLMALIDYAPLALDVISGATAAPKEDQAAGEPAGAAAKPTGRRPPRSQKAGSASR